MKCPIDGATLLIADRQGVEIDYCPDCRGVWLDRGDGDRDRDRDRDYDRGRESQQYDPRYAKKKKKGWLSEVFEFGGDD